VGADSALQLRATHHRRRLEHSYGVAVDASGNVYISNSNGGNVLKEAPQPDGSYKTSTIASGLRGPEGVAVDSSGNVYITQLYGGVLKEAPQPDGGYTQSTSTIGSSLSGPLGVAVDSSGNVYIADDGNNRVLKEALQPDGSYTQSVIGSGLSSPSGVAVDSAGNVYIVDSSNGRTLEEQVAGANFGSVPVGTTSAAQTLTFTFDTAGTIGAPMALTMGAPNLDFAMVSGGSSTCTSGSSYNAGDICTIDVTFTPKYSGLREGAVELTNSSGTVIATAYVYGVGAGPQVAFSPATQSTLANGLNQSSSIPSGVAVDGAGNVYVADLYAGVYKLGFTTPPSLSFASTPVGSQSSDSPKTVTVENVGNQALTFPIPSTGNNPSVSANFAWDESSTCQQNDAGSATAFTLAAGASCTIGIDFAPTTAGSISGSAVLTDDSGNAAAPGYLSQTIGLSGTATVGALAKFVVSAPGTATAGVPVSVTLTAVDAFGATVTTFDGTAALTGGGQSLGTVTFSDGSATPNITLTTAGTETITAADTADASVTGTAQITVQPGPAASLSVSAPSLAYLGQAVSVTAAETDAYGNVATSYSGTATVTSSDAKATLPSGVIFTDGEATFDVTFGTVGSQTVTVRDSSSLAGTSGSVAVSIPNYVVTTAADDAGAAANCTPQSSTTRGTDADCSLRDALLAAAGAGSGNIYFDATVFAAANTAAQNTITLTNGTLTIPSNTTIQGSTTGSGASLTNLVTVDGNNAYTVFTVNTSVTASIANLTIADGYSTGVTAPGAGINNAGALTVADSTFSGNSSSFGGGGIYNSGTLKVTGSTFFGNEVTHSGGGGGAIANTYPGTLVVIGSTLTGNTAPGGGGIFDEVGVVTVIGSTISGNTAFSSGGGIDNDGGTLGLANSVVSGDAGGDVSGGYIDHGGNKVGAASVNLAPLGNYGGPTQTMIPLPGSPAICAGLNVDIPVGVTTDQRGEPGTNTAYPGYSATAPCVDAGAVQTNYALAFSAQPSEVLQNTVMLPAPAVTLTESGSPFTAASETIPLALTTGPGTLSGGLAATAKGVAAYSALSIDTPGTGDVLTATLLLNSSLPTPLSLSAASSTFNVMPAVMKLAFTPAPPSLLAFGGNAGTVTVAEENASNATVTTATDTITLAVSGPNGYSQSYTAKASAGVASFDLGSALLNSAGSYSYTASIVGNAAVTAATVIETVSPATPVVSWPAPAAIVYGTALSTTQLDATATYNGATVQGAFVYTPAAGTVLAAGAYTLSAQFTPTDTADYATPAAVTASLTVNKAALTVTAANATRVFGAANPAFSGTVTGAVHGDTFTESYTTTATPASNAGSYAIVPSVTGVNLADYTVTSINGTLTVTQAATATTLSASATSITPGQSLTLTARVADASTGSTGTPTGAVSFYDGTTLLGSGTLTGGTATYTTSTLAPGATHAFSDIYAGDADFTGSASASAVSVPVAALDFSLNTSGAQSQTVMPGGAASYSFQISPTYGSYPSQVTFSASGLPVGATATFSPAAIAANGGAQTVMLTIQTQGPATAAKKGSPFERGAPLMFGFLLLPLLGVRRMRKTWLGRGAMMVLLMLAGIAGMASLSGCGAANGFNSQAVKNYTVTVTAASAGVQHSFDLTLNVQ
jgi:hypothetical protein